MGNTKSSQWTSSLQHDYTPHNSIIHPYFGLIKIFSHNHSPQEVFLKQIEAETLGSYDQMKYKVRMNMNNPRLIKVIDVHIEAKGSKISCSGDKVTYLFTGIWEYPGTNTLLTYMNSKSTPWSENRVWIIIMQLVEALSNLEFSGIHHTYICPQNIFIKDDGIILAEPKLIPGLRSGYQQIYFNYDTDSPCMSPAQLIDLQSKKIVSDSDKTKNDVYSLGMSLLQCISMKNKTPYYDYNELTINHPVVYQNLQLQRLVYSQALIDFISYILTESEKDRPTFIRLKELLVPYKNLIERREDFAKNVTFYNGVFVMKPLQILIPTDYPVLKQSSIQFLQPSKEESYKPQIGLKYRKSIKLEPQRITDMDYSKKLMDRSITVAPQFNGYLQPQQYIDMDQQSQSTKKDQIRSRMTRSITSVPQAPQRQNNYSLPPQMPTHQRTQSDSMTPNNGPPQHYRQSSYQGYRLTESDLDLRIQIALQRSQGFIDKQKKIQY